MDKQLKIFEKRFEERSSQLEGKLIEQNKNVESQLGQIMQLLQNKWQQHGSSQSRGLFFEIEDADDHDTNVNGAIMGMVMVFAIQLKFLSHLGFGTCLEDGLLIGLTCMKWLLLLVILHMGTAVGSHKGNCRMYSITDGKLNQLSQFDV